MIFQLKQYRISIWSENKLPSAFGEVIKIGFQAFRTSNRRVTTVFIEGIYIDAIVAYMFLIAFGPKGCIPVNLVILPRVGGPKNKGLDLHILLCRIGKYAQGENHCENQKNCKKSFHFKYSLSSLCLIAKKFIYNFTLYIITERSLFCKMSYIRKYHNFVGEYNIVCYCLIGGGKRIISVSIKVAVRAQQANVSSIDAIYVEAK